MQGKDPTHNLNRLHGAVVREDELQHTLHVLLLANVGLEHLEAWPVEVVELVGDADLDSTKNGCDACRVVRLMFEVRVGNASFALDRLTKANPKTFYIILVLTSCLFPPFF